MTSLFKIKNVEPVHAVLSALPATTHVAGLEKFAVDPSRIAAAPSPLKEVSRHVSEALKTSTSISSSIPSSIPIPRALPAAKVIAHLESPSIMRLDVQKALLAEVERTAVKTAPAPSLDETFTRLKAAPSSAPQRLAQAVQETRLETQLKALPQGDASTRATHVVQQKLQDEALIRSRLTPQQIKERDQFQSDQHHGTLDSSGPRTQLLKAAGIDYLGQVTGLVESVASAAGAERMAHELRQERERYEGIAEHRRQKAKDTGHIVEWEQVVDAKPSGMPDHGVVLNTIFETIQTGLRVGDYAESLLLQSLPDMAVILGAGAGGRVVALKAGLTAPVAITAAGIAGGTLASVPVNSGRVLSEQRRQSLALTGTEQTHLPAALGLGLLNSFINSAMGMERMFSTLKLPGTVGELSAKQVGKTAGAESLVEMTIGSSERYGAKVAVKELEYFGTDFYANLWAQARDGFIVGGAVTGTGQFGSAVSAKRNASSVMQAHVEPASTSIPTPAPAPNLHLVVNNPEGHSAYQARYELDPALQGDPAFQGRRKTGTSYFMPQKEGGDVPPFAGSLLDLLKPSTPAKPGRGKGKRLSTEQKLEGTRGNNAADLPAVLKLLNMLHTGPRSAAQILPSMTKEERRSLDAVAERLNVHSPLQLSTKLVEAFDDLPGAIAYIEAQLKESNAAAAQKQSHLPTRVQAKANLYGLLVGGQHAAALELAHQVLDGRAQVSTPETIATLRALALALGGKAEALPTDGAGLSTYLGEVFALVGNNKENALQAIERVRARPVEWAFYNDFIGAQPSYGRLHHDLSDTEFALLRQFIGHDYKPNAVAAQSKQTLQNITKQGEHILAKLKLTSWPEFKFIYPEAAKELTDERVERLRITNVSADEAQHRANTQNQKRTADAEFARQHTKAASASEAHGKPERHHADSVSYERIWKRAQREGVETAVAKEGAEWIEISGTPDEVRLKVDPKELHQLRHVHAQAALDPSERAVSAQDQHAADRVNQARAQQGKGPLLMSIDIGEGEHHALYYGIPEAQMPANALTLNELEYTRREISAAVAAAEPLSTAELAELDLPADAMLKIVDGVAVLRLAQADAAAVAHTIAWAKQQPGLRTLRVEVPHAEGHGSSNANRKANDSNKTSERVRRTVEDDYDFNSGAFNLTRTLTVTTLPLQGTLAQADAQVKALPTAARAYAFQSLYFDGHRAYDRNVEGAVNLTDLLRRDRPGLVEADAAPIAVAPSKSRKIELTLNAPKDSEGSAALNTLLMMPWRSDGASNGKNSKTKNSKTQNEEAAEEERSLEEFSKSHAAAQRAQFERTLASLDRASLSYLEGMLKSEWIKDDPSGRVSNWVSWSEEQYTAAAKEIQRKFGLGTHVIYERMKSYHGSGKAAIDYVNARVLYEVRFADNVKMNMLTLIENGEAPLLQQVADVLKKPAQYDPEQAQQWIESLTQKLEGTGRLIPLEPEQQLAHLRKQLSVFTWEGKDHKEALVRIARHPRSWVINAAKLLAPISQIKIESLLNVDELMQLQAFAQDSSSQPSVQMAKNQLAKKLGYSSWNQLALAFDGDLTVVGTKKTTQEKMLRVIEADLLGAWVESAKLLQGVAPEQRAQQREQAQRVVALLGEPKTHMESDEALLSVLQQSFKVLAKGSESPLQTAQRISQDTRGWASAAGLLRQLRREEVIARLTPQEVVQLQSYAAADAVSQEVQTGRETLAQKLGYRSWSLLVLAYRGELNQLLVDPYRRIDEKPKQSSHDKSSAPKRRRIESTQKSKKVRAQDEVSQPSVTEVVTRTRVEEIAAHLNLDQLRLWIAAIESGKFEDAAYLTRFSEAYEGGLIELKQMLTALLHRRTDVNAETSELPQASVVLDSKAAAELSTRSAQESVHTEPVPEAVDDAVAPRAELDAATELPTIDFAALAHAQPHTRRAVVLTALARLTRPWHEALMRTLQVHDADIEIVAKVDPYLESILAIYPDGREALISDIEALFLAPNRTKRPHADQAVASKPLLSNTAWHEAQQIRGELEGDLHPNALYALHRDDLQYLHTLVATALKTQQTDLHQVLGLSALNEPLLARLRPIQESLGLKQEPSFLISELAQRFQGAAVNLFDALTTLRRDIERELGRTDHERSANRKALLQDGQEQQGKQTLKELVAYELPTSLASVLWPLMQGWSRKKTAQELGISRQTLKIYVNALRNRLGIEAGGDVAVSVEQRFAGDIDAVRQHLQQIYEAQTRGELASRRTHKTIVNQVHPSQLDTLNVRHLYVLSAQIFDAVKHQKLWEAFFSGLNPYPEQHLRKYSNQASVSLGITDLGELKDKFVGGIPALSKKLLKAIDRLLLSERAAGRKVESFVSGQISQYRNERAEAIRAAQQESSRQDTQGEEIQIEAPTASASSSTDSSLSPWFKPQSIVGNESSWADRLKKLSDNALLVLDSALNQLSTEKTAAVTGLASRAVQAYEAVLPGWLGVGAMDELLHGVSESESNSAGFVDLKGEVDQLLQARQRGKKSVAPVKVAPVLDVNALPETTARRVVQQLLAMSAEDAMALWAVTEGGMSVAEAAAALGKDRTEFQKTLYRNMARIVNVYEENAPRDYFLPLVKLAAQSDESASDVLWQLANNRQAWIQQQTHAPMFTDAILEAIANPADTSARLNQRHLDFMQAWAKHKGDLNQVQEALNLTPAMRNKDVSRIQRSLGIASYAEWQARSPWGLTEFVEKLRAQLQQAQSE